MNIQEYPHHYTSIILEKFAESNLKFDQDSYSCLVTPSFASISSDAVAQLNADIKYVWEWLKSTLHIYNDELDNNPDSPLVQALEWGLNDYSIALQRSSARNMELPKLGRLDSVILEPRQQIAEVQWKGGGEGFISEILNSLNKIFIDSKTEQFGNLSKGLENVFRETKTEEIVVLNTGRSLWMQTELNLSKELGERGVKFFSLPPNEVADHIQVQNGKVYLTMEGVTEKLDYIYLDRLSEALPEELLVKVIDSYREGNLFLDPPPSYIFNQKISLALPFMKQYKKYYSDEIRRIFIPSVLITNDKPDLTPIIPYIKHTKAELLAEVNNWDDLAILPKKIRGNLVIKCASSHKYNNHGGHGVFRLWGSKVVAEKTLTEVLDNVRRGNEPWIIQPYIDETWKVPFAHPLHVNQIQYYDAHARFGIYCGIINDMPQVIGSIATFSPFWKVAGKTAGFDENGKLKGSAFTDIRVKQT